MSSPSIKILYFDIKGRGEILRMILSVAGKKYDDVRIAYRDWLSTKHQAPFGQLPMLEIDGKQFGQTIPLANYLAKKFDLHGKTEFDELKVDSIVMACYDLLNQFNPAFHSKIGDEVQRRLGLIQDKESLSKEEYAKLKAEIEIDVAEEEIGFFADLSNKMLYDRYIDDKIVDSLQSGVVLKYYGYFEKQLQESPGPYFIGSYLTVADLFVLDLFTSTVGDFIGLPKHSQFPLLATFFETISQESRVKAFLTSRK